MAKSASPHSPTRATSPHITPFPRTPITPLRKTRPDLWRMITHSRKRTKAQAARHPKEDGRVNSKDPALYRNLLRFRLIEQLCWNGPFCSRVFAEELKDRLGTRYTVENQRRKFGDAYGDREKMAFETRIDLELLDVRLEIAALERARGHKLKDKFVVLGKYDDEGMFGQYVPAKPTLPTKPPSSPVKKETEVLPKYWTRRHKGRRINGIWAEMHGGQKDEEDTRNLSDLLPDFEDDCVVS